MDKKYEYGFMLGQELLHVRLVPGTGYELVMPRIVKYNSVPDTWPWTTKNTSHILRAYLHAGTPWAYRGKVLFCPILKVEGARPVAITTTTSDSGTIYKEYRGATIPKLLPNVGKVVSTAQINNKRSPVLYVFHHIYRDLRRIPEGGIQTLVVKGGFYYSYREGEDIKVFKCLEYISDQDCLLLELNYVQVDDMLCYGTLMQGDDQQYLEGILGMVDSIKEGMATPVEDCDIGW